MTEERAVAVRRRRRTPAEIEQVVSEFAGSGVNRSQFCRKQGLTLGTLNRYLIRMRENSGAAAATRGGLLPVEVASMKPDNGRSLSVVLCSGRRIEVGAAFDEAALRQLVRVLETL